MENMACERLGKADGALRASRNDVRSGLAATIASAPLLDFLLRTKEADDSEDDRLRVWEEMDGAEARRLGALLDESVSDCVGYEAEGETAAQCGRRATQVTERRNNLGGGVGGIEIHVGGE